MDLTSMSKYLSLVQDQQDDANVKPVTQTISTNPRTGETMMTIKGRPEDLSATNPLTPTVTQPGYLNLANTASTQPVAYQAPQPDTNMPVVPAVPNMTADQTYQRMLQAESGGRQFTPQGGVVTSPKGAMGVGQIMPTTAMDPGYGVTNIFDLAQQRGVAVPSRDQAGAQQLLANEQLNREFGQSYYNAMNQRFGPEGGVAAYNAGPGRVQANMMANQGQLNVAQLPQETQQYLQRVGVQPGAPAAAPVTVANAVPDTTQIQNTYINDFLQNQENPEYLAKLKYDKNAPEFIRTLASTKEYNTLKYQKDMEQVQTKMRTAVENNDSRTIAKMLGSKTDEGSLAKAFFYNLIGFQSGANAEVEKMGIKDKYEIGQLGDASVAMRTRPNGQVVGAIYTSGEKAGQAVPDDQLPLLYGAGTGGKVTTSGTFFQTPDGRILRAQSDEKGRSRLVDTATNERYTGSSRGLVKLEEAGAMRKMDYGLITDLKKKFGTDALNALGEYQKLTGPLNQDDQQRFLQLYGFGQAQPTGALPTQAPPPVATPAPAPAPGTVQPGIEADRSVVRQPVAQAPVAPVAPTTQTQAQPAPAQAPAPVAPRDLTKPISQLEQEREAQKKIVESQARNAQQAKSIAPDVAKIRDLVNKSTGSGVGTIVDKVGNFVGYSTSGAEAIAAIGPLADKVLKSVERFEGPQSNIDVQSYKEAAGKLADPTVPAAQKQAAFDTILSIMKRNAPDIDWAMYERAPESPQEKARKELQRRKGGV